jgi:hypothetical protein
VRVFGHANAYFVGNVAGTVAGMAAGMSICTIAAGTSSLVACGFLAQKAAKLYTAIDTVAGIANATSNIAAGNASLGDALAFLPVMTVGVQKLRGAPTNCFIAGTLVAVAGVNAGTGTADAGPSSASKPIEEIQVGDFVWARAEHDPSAPAVLQKVVALYRNTAHDLQTLDVVGEQGISGTAWAVGADRRHRRASVLCRRRRLDDGRREVVAAGVTAGEYTIDAGAGAIDISRWADLSTTSTACSSSTAPPPGSERGWKSIQVTAVDCSPGKAPGFRWTPCGRIELIDRGVPCSFQSVEHLLRYHARFGSHKAPRNSQVREWNCDDRLVEQPWLAVVGDHEAVSASAVGDEFAQGR